MLGARVNGESKHLPSTTGLVPPLHAGAPQASSLAARTTTRCGRTGVGQQVWDNRSIIVFSEMPHCIGEYHGRRCDRPTVNGLDVCAACANQVETPRATTPGSGGGGSSTTSDEREGQEKGREGGGEGARAFHSRELGDQAGKSNELRTRPNLQQQQRPSRFREAPNRDNIALGGKRLLALLAEDGAHDGEGEQGEIAPCPRAGDTVRETHTRRILSLVS